jgi:riboflavin kinase/FMN adenylyltransferase
LKVHNYGSFHKYLFKAPVVTVGIFDGVHKGHKQILDILKNKASQTGGESVIVTLWPHPRVVLYPGKEIKLLNTLEEKKALLEQAGIDHLVVIPFSNEFAKLSAHQFISNVLIDAIGMQALVLGFDNHFGNNKEGDYSVVKEVADQLNFEIVHPPVVFEADEKVSSTSIRVFLELGEVEKAANFLGYPYSLSGKVVLGRKLGRTIGFPTANIEQDNLKMLPSVGVYAVVTTIGNKKYMGMMNIGFRPTLEKSLLHKTLEVHLINFDGDLYGKEITVTFANRLRDEIKFSGIEELKAQLNTDKAHTIELFKNSHL